MNEERWLPVVGYEGYYEVSDQGRVRSVERTITYKDGRVYGYPSKLIKLHKRSNYYYVRLRISCSLKSFAIHRLVLSTFAPVDGWEELEVRHNDDTPANNQLTNLCWGTSQDNSNDCVSRNRQSRGEKVPQSKLRERDVKTIRQLFDDGRSQAAISRLFVVDPETIRNVVLGKSWSHI